jgi:streptomycin 6-kinase
LTDGRLTVLLKLACTPEARNDLARWRQFADVLTRRYRAPRMVGWLDVNESSGGPIFEWIDGTTPVELGGVPLGSVASLLRDLHSDAELAESLARPGAVSDSCAEAYRQSYHHRFLEDLASFMAEVPPFVTSDTLEWLRNEAFELEWRIAASPAFAEPANRAVHGDLWLNNLLVSDPDHWYVLDWDGLGLGDPVMDWAMLFGPSRQHVDADPEAAASVATFTPAERERLRTYARASLLDWVIDPLADWVQAATEPFHGEAIRSGNDRVHRQALAWYRTRYGGRRVP